MAERPIESRPGPALLRSAIATSGSPLFLLGCAVLLCAALLARPLVMPLGAMYWDLVLYLDAANRIASGQTPLIDFLTPVGPLGYWLFAWLDGLFPHAQPLLLAQWSLLPVTAPAMALVLREVDRRSRPAALGLLLPYLVFQLLPINVEQYSFFPGLDGFGIYNRQVSIVLYVLAAALVFLRSGTLLVAILAWTLLALLLLKVTGFLAGGLVVAFAVLAGRLDWRHAFVAIGVACAALLTLELVNGMVSAYAASIAALVAMNARSILPRFLQAGSLHLDIVAAGSGLILALVVFGWQELRLAFAALRRERSWAALGQLVDRDAGWLAAALAAGLFFETQNTGGQAFIFAWPVLLAILLRWLGSGRPGALVICALVAATAIPPLETVLQRAGRALLAQANYLSLPHAHLGRLGLVSQHPEVIARAGTMQAVYAAQPATFQAIADKGLLPSQSFYAELDFQAGWLMAVDAGIAAILDHEARTGTRFGTIMSLNFANPFPYLMERTGVRHVPIGADPARAVPAPNEAARAAIAEADLILYPLCPLTVANQTLRGIYAEATAGRREIALGVCWKGYVRR
jgi:hypothetical protein